MVDDELGFGFGELDDVRLRGDDDLDELELFVVVVVLVVVDLVVVLEVRVVVVVLVDTSGRRWSVSSSSPKTLPMAPKQQQSRMTNPTMPPPIAKSLFWALLRRRWVVVKRAMIFLPEDA
ncbi:hypothetical protein [Janibacter terrae]|uniref:hypothetical protein n=1 Tax=Janibacter terrae TaxID=103817 RepID=UPI0031F859FF